MVNQDLFPCGVVVVALLSRTEEACVVNIVVITRTYLHRGVGEEDESPKWMGHSRPVCTIIAAVTS